MKMTSAQQNLSFCRLCLSINDKLHHVFSTDETDSLAISLPMKIFLCTKIIVSKDDTLPQKICLNCLNYLNEWYLFRKKCRDVNMCLKKKVIDRGDNKNSNSVENLETSENVTASFNDFTDSKAPDLNLDINNDIIINKTSTNLQNDKALQIDNIIKNNDKSSIFLRKHKFKCLFCPDSFYYLKDLKSHRNLLHKLNSSVEKITPLSDSNFKVEEISLNNMYKMKCCDKFFFSKLQFVRHYKEKHPGEKPFMCDICGKKDFISEETLKRHKILHSGKFRCDICSKTFTSKAILLLHKRDKHENDKPFICDTCGKCFVSELLMNYHKRFHTGEKKYVCEECGVAVVTSSSLAKHKRIHSKEKPHVCQICGKGFIVKGRLAEHIRVHTGERPFACQICQKGFTIKHKLKRHILSHSGEKLFFCEYCGNSYSTKYRLSIHLKSHNEQQVFKEPV